MIGFVYGTTGELIKIAPLMHALQAHGMWPLTLTTGQQVQQIPAFLEDMRLPAPDLWLARGHRGGDLERKAEIPGWAATVARNVMSHRTELRRRLASDGNRPLVVVHGDTMTTVLGALIGRTLGADVAHVEAGLRSGYWRDPFPEELNRRIAARIAKLHLAPGETAVANLRRERVTGQIIDTHSNTITDSLRLAADAQPGVEPPDEPFGIVSLHRFELIERSGAFQEVLETLFEHSRRQPLLFIDHSTTAEAITRHGFERFFDDRFRRIPRLRYTPFIALLKHARFLVTDSGGSQEECARLGIPCVIHRALSERQDGLGANVLLSGMDVGVVRQFLADPERLRVPPVLGEASPTETIIEALAAGGFLPSAVPS
jgi:UDP-N-acetylglucosamine 2-epimerase (non-hydrolysing)